MAYPTDIFRRNFQTGFFRRLFGLRPDFISETREILHDLSNPLTVISLSMERLQRDVRIRNGNARRHIRAALQASRKMRLFLTDARQKLSAKESVSLFDISTEIENAVNIIRPISRKSGIKIKFRSKRAVFVSGDRVKLFRVISNILSNAVDSYAHAPIARNKVVIVRICNEKGRAVISVRDFGCGIPKTMHKKIFRPFYTTKEKREGMGGLGLSIVKNIVEREFKGRIRLQSAPGRGSTFKIILPV